MQQEIWFHKYRIMRLLGKGGNAEVYLAEHIKLNSFRAIKCISKTHPLYDLQCKEALILKNLKHSCIPIIYDIEEDEERSYIVEQYLEGETLKNYVMEKGPIREETIVYFALQLCDLIKYLHSLERPILYVDLKPDNIILSGTTLKLIDFGSATYRDELSNRKGHFATRGYAAPELYRNGTIDERCDVYGIGMLMYFMVTGQQVKTNCGIDNIDYAGKCSGQLKRIINHCLKYNPSQRFISVAGLSRELSAIRLKNQFQMEPDHLVKIAVAGAQPRIGVTHLAIRLCRYFISQGYRCLYQENNNSGCVWSIKDCYNEIDVRQGLAVIHEIPMLAYEASSTPDLKHFDFIVQDYGSLSEKNLPVFSDADVKLVILGAKDWELKYGEQVINLTAEYKDITYLFNFTNGRQFQQIMKSMERKCCYRVPYEPDPFAKIILAEGQDFFHEILSPILTGKKKGMQSLRGR